MKKPSRTDKLIRLGTLSLIAGLALPLACSDDAVPENQGDGGWITDGAGGYGGKTSDGGKPGYDGGLYRDGAPLVGGCGAGKGGGCARGGVGGVGGRVHIDGSAPDRDAGPDDAGL
jgi:hypothetical protein